MLTEANLHEYQKRAKKFVIDKEKTALFIDMGLGKTVITLSAYKELIDDFATKKILIIAPLRVANNVWHTEASNWEHLKDLKFSIVTGTLKQRLEALKIEADFYVINRENIVWLVEYYKSKFPFDTLIIDESSSFKNSSSKRFRALRSIINKIKYVTLLTGTPSPNGYMDLFSQVFLVDKGERLGKYITNFRNTYFDVDFMGYNYRIKDGADIRIQDKIKDITLSMDAEDYLTLPDFISSVIYEPLTKDLQKQYKEFENEMMLNFEDENLNAVSSATLSNKLLQFSSGAIYNEDKQVINIHNLKTDMLDELLENNPDDNFLIAYNYKHELDRLLTKYPYAIQIDKKGKVINDWNNGKIKILIGHPASVGHGLNLQFGGSVIVWFGFTWSLELYQQFNKRLLRQGQTKPVRCFHLAVGDIELRLMRVLSTKNITQKRLLESLKFNQTLSEY